MNNKNYLIFGFHPATGLTIPGEENAGSISYSDPSSEVVLTLPKMSPVSPIDVCVCVGVKKGEITDDGNGNQVMRPVGGSIYLGDYSYAATQNDNYIYLLMDHLFSCINFEFYIEQQYQELRDIIIRQVEITSETCENVSMTVTLHPNTTGADPVYNDNDVAYNPAQTPAESTATIFNSTDNAKGLLHTTTPVAVPGYFLPPYTGSTPQTCKMTVTYDVLDKATPQQIVRQNATAVNNFTLPTALQRGRQYTMKVTVTPTYLYQLSDNDLNNPTLTFN